MDDVKIAKMALSNIPIVWNGKDCVLELKRVDYNWRQMEWPGFYFEYLCRSALRDAFTIPGERIGSVTFDAKRAINWDFKSKTISPSDHGAILNDVSAMDESIRRYGMHGIIVAMCEAEYDDASRSFQEWHGKLKGGLSSYEKSRIARTSVSRLRKTKMKVKEILFLNVNPANVTSLGKMNQGRNSNGKPRPPKYMIDFRRADIFISDQINF